MGLMKNIAVEARTVEPHHEAIYAAWLHAGDVMVHDGVDYEVLSVEYSGCGEYVEARILPNKILELHCWTPVRIMVSTG